MNSLNLIGNLASDGEIKTVGENLTIYEGAIYFKTNGKRKEDQKDPVINFTIFGKQAETFAQDTKKGHKVALSGELDMDSWEDKNGGGNRTKHKMKVNNFTFIQGKEGGEANNVVPMQRNNENPAPSLVVPANAPDYQDIPF